MAYYDFLFGWFQPGGFIEGAVEGVKSVPLIIETAHNFVSSLIAAAGDLIDVIEIVPLPSAWMSILSAMIVAIIGFRAYGFIKDAWMGVKW